VGNLRNDGEWTEGRYRSFITSTLRGGMRRWPPKWKALKEAELGRKTNKKSGKLAMHYRCACCHNEYTSKDVQVDHVEPVVNPTTGFVSWDVYIDRMFCNSVNLQVLCKTCHNTKTAKEKDDAKRGRSVVTPRNKRV
jgi:cytochrome c553